MPLAPADPLVEVDDIFVPPVGGMAVSDDDVGGFNEGPLQVRIALLDHAAIVGSAGAGAELGHQAAVAGEVFGGLETIDGAHLTIDEDGQDFGRSRDGLDELDSWSGLDPFNDSILQSPDMFAQGIEDLQLLKNAAPGLFWEPLQSDLQLGPPLRSEDVAGGVQGEGILRQGGTDAVLNPSAVLNEGHASPGKLPFIAHLSWWDPNRGQLAQVEQGGQPLGIEFVGLVNVAHHDLGLGGVGQKGNATGGFDLIDDPVPVSDGLERNGCAFRELREEDADGVWDVANPSALHQVPLPIQNCKE